MSDCLFCKIIAGEIPSAKVYEDDLCYAFKDISPLAPTHFLVVPKQHFASAAEVTPENEAVIGHIYTVIAKLAKEQGFADGYRVVTNVGELAGQTVHHIHMDIVGRVNALDIPAEISKVGRKNGGGDFDHGERILSHWV